MSLSGLDSPICRKRCGKRSDRFASGSRENESMKARAEMLCTFSGAGKFRFDGVRDRKGWMCKEQMNK